MWSGFDSKLPIRIQKCRRAGLKNVNPIYNEYTLHHCIASDYYRYSQALEQLTEAKAASPKPAVKSLSKKKKAPGGC